MSHTRMKGKLIAVLIAVAILAVNVTGAAQQAPNSGGRLNVAIGASLPMLDPQLTTAFVTTSVGLHIFETLFARTHDYEPIPWLVDTYNQSTDGMTLLLNLRQGVYFHNGEEMDSGDVVASLNRWGEYSPQGPTYYEYVDTIQVIDKYTVQINFRKPFGPAISMLAYPNGGAFIFPEEIIAATGPKPISSEQCIGTGPYQLKEWLPGQSLHLVKFKNFHGDPRGEGIAYLDEIVFTVVPEVETRVAGVAAGDYDFATGISPDLYEELVANPKIRVHLLSQSYPCVFLNSKEGVLSNPAMHRAILAALDMRPILQSAFGELYELNGALMSSNSVWYTETGTDAYNQGDPKLAQELARAAGYNGEPIRFMVTTQYIQFYYMGLVATEQLLHAGFNIDLQLYDWPTLVERRHHPELWDMFFTSQNVKSDPVFMVDMTPQFYGWWESEEQKALLEALRTEIGFENRYKVFEDLQTLFYEELPFIVIGYSYNVSISTPEVGGLEKPVFPPDPFDVFLYIWLAED